MFETQVYINRRNKLKQNLNHGLILLYGNKENSRNFRDNHYPFRQDSTILYYTGLNIPGISIVIDIDEDKEILFGKDPTIEDSIWSGPKPSLDELCGSAGIEECISHQDIKNWLKKNTLNRKIHFLPPYRDEHLLKLQNWLGLSSIEIQNQKSIDLIRAVVEQRNVKSKKEILLIEEAIEIASQMHLEAIRKAKAGMKEYELMSIVYKKALELNADLSFPIILTTKGHILHNNYYGNTLKEGDMVLCDAGAEHKSGYASDITRTFPVGKYFSDLQRIIYQIVLETQQAVVENLRPNAIFKELHMLACRKITEGLKNLGIMQGNVQDAVTEGAHALFFPCGLGHMMGLDVHDMENLGEEFVGYTETIQKSKVFGLKSLRFGKEIKPGHVVTVEPGIYFIPELIDRWAEKRKYKAFINYSRLEEFRHFGGIRIEDAYLITKDANRLLGDHLPKTIKELENLK